MPMRFCVLFVFTAFISTVLSQSAPHFADGLLVCDISNPDIDDPSGLAASRLHPGVLYIHNDGGDIARIFAIDATNCQTMSTISIKGASNHDWEDISVGPCGAVDPSRTCIYIGDIGDRHGGSASVIYRVVEPAQIQNGSMVVEVDSTLYYTWDEPDSETLMVDQAGEVYLASNERGKAKLTQLPRSSWGTDTPVEVTSFIDLPVASYVSEPRAGDISPDGQEVLMQYHHLVYYWSAPNKNYFEALKQQPVSVPYHLAHTSEAIAWDSTGSGYYTLNEHTNAPLYYYKRM